MPLKTNIFAAISAAAFAMPALAADIMIKDPYMRSSTPNAKVGAAFMGLMNHSDQDDRLIGARTDIAKKVELHTHIEEDGVMKMREIEGGIMLPAGGMAMLQRGGDHIMMMGLTRGLEQGEVIPVTLVFENAGEITIDVPVDRERKGGHMHKMDN